MAIKQIVLTEEEYENLLKVQDEPNEQLRATNKALAEKYDALKESKAQEIVYDFKSPFKVEDNTLDFTTKEDFVAFYNHLSLKQEMSRPPLMKIDQLMFDFITDLAEVWVFQPPFKDVRVLKSFRVSLVKSGMYILRRNNTLEKREKETHERAITDLLKGQ